MRKPELRPNNTVGMKLDVFPHNIFTVTEVGDTMKVWDGADSHFFDVDDLQGVPLTEEWLFKFGFEKLSNFEEQYMEEDYVWQIEVEHSPTLLLVNGVFHEDNYGVKLEYVHQLQNLYYALTGEDLIVKP